MTTCHFAQRCIERGIRSVSPMDLLHALRRAYQEGDGDMIEHVMDDDLSGHPIYRFRVAEGRFYAPFTHDGWPMTVLTQRMIRNKKWARKKRKKPDQMTRNQHMRRARA